MRVRQPDAADGYPPGDKSGSVGVPQFAPVARRRHVRGFTLVELMITLVVAIVLIMIAVPSFKNLTLYNKLTTTANDLVNAINSARMEAIKRNANTQFCSNSISANMPSADDILGQQCGTETGAVYATNGASTTQILAGTAGIAAPIQLSRDMTALRFTAQGLARKVGGTTAPYSDVVVDICTSQMSVDNHRVITMAAGSILTTTNDSRVCPSP